MKAIRTEWQEGLDEVVTAVEAGQTLDRVAGQGECETTLHKPVMKASTTADSCVNVLAQCSGCQAVQTARSSGGTQALRAARQMLTLG